MEPEDKLLVFRGILGGVAGLISAFTQSFLYSLLIVIAIYLISLPLAKFVLNMELGRTAYTKGIITLIVAWFLILIIAYNSLV
ncbi:MULTISPECIES: hypothetical protein [Metallosphaera]|uniref:Uncharacterized protein n=3 Tax=Metallosphaera TaxID=41980 RepID=A4YD31_METS5|nr:MULTISPECIES: hypothetical protein [Metallosphaera]ABP94333.1 hypothetical protein Msed_0156 [Metallosphaera sedula DSM 5348]AIM26320.1 hypothetical protein HA72_0156 [Metallosphaera sedula]AKV73331.1 hypothetical protein MsedA_0164 [Metallosphaera sedula]AKV75575.1 hypothetical protein MsedB_0164 [Metallosphaera sedula]AKV77821.1 hypothetical protein MsedC_0163 [Metallosphaera sedula]